MADPWGCTFINISALEAVANKATFTLALSPTLDVSTEGTGMATPIIFLALIDVLTVGAISNISIEADAAVAAWIVVAAGLWVTAVQASDTFIDIVALQTIALVAHLAHTDEVDADRHTLGQRVALAACCFAVIQVSS